MTYHELKIALDIGDPATILSSIGFRPISALIDPKSLYYVVCDDGNCYAFDQDGKEHEIDNIPMHCFSIANIKTIIVPKTVKSIGDYAFSWCGNLVKAVIPDSITRIESGTFHRCFSLKNVSLGSNVKAIDDWTFDYCIGLEELLFPESLESIGHDAFYQCSRLRSLTLPSAVKNIGECVFSNCGNLDRVLFKGKTIDQVKAMDNYPWGIKDTSIIQAEL